MEYSRYPAQDCLKVRSELHSHLTTRLRPSITVFVVFSISLSRIPAVQEEPGSLPLLLQVCDGGGAGGREGGANAEGTDGASGLPGSLLQQSGVYPSSPA